MCVDNDRYSFRPCLIVRAMRRALPTLERDLRPPDSFQDQLLHFGIVSRNVPVRIITQEIRKAFSCVERIHSSYGIEGWEDDFLPSLSTLDGALTAASADTIGLERGNAHRVQERIAPTERCHRGKAPAPGRYQGFRLR